MRQLLSHPVTIFYVYLVPLYKGLYSNHSVNILSLTKGPGSFPTNFVGLTSFAEPT